MRDDDLTLLKDKCSLQEEIIANYSTMLSVLEDSSTYEKCKKQIEYLNDCISDLKI